MDNPWWDRDAPCEIPGERWSTPNSSVAAAHPCRNLPKAAASSKEEPLKHQPTHQKLATLPRIQWIRSRERCVGTLNVASSWNFLTICSSILGRIAYSVKDLICGRLQPNFARTLPKSSSRREFQAKAFLPSLQAKTNVGNSREFLVNSVLSIKSNSHKLTFVWFLQTYLWFFHIHLPPRRAPPAATCIRCFLISFSFSSALSKCSRSTEAKRALVLGDQWRFPRGTSNHPSHSTEQPWWLGDPPF